MTKHKHGKHPSDHPASCGESHTHDAAGAAAKPEVSPATDAVPSQESAAIEKLQAEIASLKDRELRARAELDNYRKRASKELTDSLRYANLPLMRDLLPVLDNIERAIQAAEQNADGTHLLEGVKMVRQQLEDVLQQHQCKRIEALHLPFDPNLHHAIMQQPSEEFAPNTVVMVTQNGYQLHDRVVRPSQVIVSSAAAKPEE